MADLPVHSFVNRAGSQSALDETYLAISPYGVGDDRRIPLDSLLSRLDLPVTTSGFNQLIARDKGGQVFNVLAYGLVADGATDNSAAFATLLTAVVAAGGGVIHFPKAALSYVFLSKWTIPNNGAATPQQVPIVIEGEGGFYDGVWTGTPIGGTVVDIQSSTAPAKIDTRGKGVLVLRDIVIRATAGTGPMFQTTNTTLLTDNVCLYGSAAGAAAVNDGFVLGSTTTTIDGSATAAFQGYGTIIARCFFSNIRRCVFAQTFANNVIIEDNTISTTCGFTTGAAFDILGNAGVGAGANGVVIQRNTVEISNYKYGIQATNGSQSTFGPNGYYDPTGTTTAFVRCELNSMFNLIIAGFHDDAKTFVSDAASPSVQTIINSHQSQNSVWSQPQLVTTTSPVVKTTAGSTGWIITASATTEQWFQQISGAGDLHQVTVPVGGANETITRTIRASATSALFQIGIAATSTGKLLLAQSGGAAITSIQSGALAATRNYILPVVDPSPGQALVATLAGSDIVLSFASPGTGTVTSVSFTGGIVSVATATTTPALTVAGTSGGIVYFSSASTWASSAGLSLNGVVYGGGAGGAPSSTAQGTANSILTANAGAPVFSQTPTINNSLQIGVASSVTGSLILANSASAFLTTIQAGNAAAARTYIWPTNFGAAGSVLYDSAGNGVLSWSTSSGIFVTTLQGFSGAQTLAFGTSGTDLNVTTDGSTVSLNVPSASATARGVITTGTQTFAGAKTFTGATVIGNTLLFKRLISPQAGSPVTVAAADSGTHYTNTGAAGAITFNLPAASGSGNWYTFSELANQNIIVDAAGTDTIQVGGSVSSAGGTATLSAVGSSLTIEDAASGKWVATAGQGSATTA